MFKAWSSAEHVKRWFSPETYTVPDARVQMHAGGAFDICMRSPTGEEHWTRGTFVEVTPHASLVIDMLVTDQTGKELMRRRASAPLPVWSVTSMSITRLR